MTAVARLTLIAIARTSRGVESTAERCMSSRPAGYRVTRSAVSESVSISDPASSVRPSPDPCEPGSFSRASSPLRSVFAVSPCHPSQGSHPAEGFVPIRGVLEGVNLARELSGFPLRSVLRFSQPLDGLRHLRLSGLIASRSHVQGCSVQGVLPNRSRPDSSPGRAPMPLSPERSLTEASCHARTTRLRGLAPRSDAFLRVGV
jgi:hypothetical protein